MLARFGDWARARQLESFWGVAKLGTGQVCLLLETEDASFRVIVLTSADDLYIVVGDSEPGASSEQARVGADDDDPGEVFAATLSWLIDRAVLALDDDTRYAYRLADAAWRLALRIGESDECLLALDIKKRATPA